MAGILGPNFTRSSYLSMDLKRKLTTRGQGERKEVLKTQFGWDEALPIVSPVIRIDPVKASIKGWL